MLLQYYLTRRYPKACWQLAADATVAGLFLGRMELVLGGNRQDLGPGFSKNVLTALPTRAVTLDHDDPTHPH